MIQVQWSDGFLIWAVYAIVAVLIKPLIGLALPPTNKYQNNAVRLCGFVISYLLTLGNHAVVTHFTWPQAWGLVPVAAGVYALAAITYHITDDTGFINAPAPTTPPSPPPAPPLAASAHVDPSPRTPARTVRGTYAKAPVAASAPPAVPPTAVQEQPMVWKNAPEHIQDTGSTKGT